MRGCGQHSSGSVADSYEHGNEASGSIIGGKFLNQLSEHQLLKKVSSPWSQSVSQSVGSCGWQIPYSRCSEPVKEGRLRKKVRQT